MKTQRILPLLFIFVISLSAFSQKRPLEPEDVLKWNRITEQRISNDGQYIVYNAQPWKGDPELFITNIKGEQINSFACGTGSVITEDSKFLIFTIQPESELVREEKLKKTKKDKMSKPKLAVYNFETQLLDTILNMKSFKLPAKWAGVLAFQVEQSEKAEGRWLKAEGKGQKTEEKGNGKEEEKEKEEEELKKESDKNGRQLVVRNLVTGTEKLFPFVTKYQFASEKELLVFISSGDDKEFDAGVYAYNVKEGLLSPMILGDGTYSQLSVKKDGELVAFLADIRDEKERKDNEQNSLYVWKGDAQAVKLADNFTAGIPSDWEISKNGRISFSESGNRVFFGTAPIAVEKDTTILEEEKPNVDIWHWNEPVLHTVQLKNKSREAKKTYMAVYHLDMETLVQLGTKDLNSISLIQKGDAKFVLATSNLPYAVQTMWEGSPSHNDFYLIDIKTGKPRMIKKDVRAYPRVSPGGNYLFWFNAIDTTWNTYDLAKDIEYQLCNAQIIQTANELNDVPNPPGSYRSAGWIKGDEALVVYDRYNIWSLDPNNEQIPKNLTNATRADGISYRIIDFDRQKSSEEGIIPENIKLLKGHNEITREDGYYSWSMSESKGQKAKGKGQKAILCGSFKLSTPQKAKNYDAVVFTKEDFQTFPNLLSSDLKFKNIVQVSDVNPQQKNFLWGTVELLSWTSLDGRKLEGTLHKPENFDPNKKYPMIVNFYEKSSQGLFGHHIPERGRSTIDYHQYTSNGYLIFNPDVYYKEGYPGEDAFNCVMPGITALIQRGFVDEEAIGAQGHSWGGYQVAYLATRTNLFAAIESGAPVVNMFSAYGGIRWGSGLNRSFQYEHTQSRIGKSIWESPLRYMENSPLFTMDKVQTPILIMHNDDDGAVPWYQGIEYFIALRRLGKPAWLLNYNNAAHWPTRLEDKHDFQIRLLQFFDHYLKGAPMPEWMEKGVPAVEKDVNLGY
ncbi:MAG: prolyl oligopeptidase family serine peptidase [Bacteroidota bacterium]|nr:prolyl oligopeptidase family serine peptidase [Bacteroidota bacterium]